MASWGKRWWGGERQIVFPRNAAVGRVGDDDKERVAVAGEAAATAITGRDSIDAWSGTPGLFLASSSASRASLPKGSCILFGRSSQERNLCEGHRFDLRFPRPFRADLSIRKSSSFFPPFIAATSQLGLAPRPAHVSPDGPRYFGGTLSSSQCASPASGTNQGTCPIHLLQLLFKLSTMLKKHFVNPLSQVHERFNGHP